MSDEQLTVTLTPQDVQQLRHLQSLSDQVQHQALTQNADVQKIVSVGQREYGTEKFDAASQAFANAIPAERLNDTLAVLRQADAPHRFIVELSDDPQKLERFARLSPERQRAEISLRENRAAPYGRALASADPLYKSAALSGGPVSDADWNSGIADRMSDKDAFAEIDRRWEEKCKKRGGRW